MNKENNNRIIINLLEDPNNKINIETYNKILVYYELLTDNSINKIEPNVILTIGKKIILESNQNSQEFNYFVKEIIKILVNAKLTKEAKILEDLLNNNPLTFCIFLNNLKGNYLEIAYNLETKGKIQEATLMIKKVKEIIKLINKVNQMTKQNTTIKEDSKIINCKFSKNSEENNQYLKKQLIPIETSIKKMERGQLHL